MMGLRFEIGQEVWVASFESEAEYLTCPDCGGTKHIRCVLFDGSEVAIPCEGCRRGYEPPDGTVRVYRRRANAIPATVTGVEIYEGVAEWRTTHTYAKDEDVFATRDKALARAEVKAADADREERGRVLTKEKPTKSWAWHVHYHRKSIRDAEKNIAYHQSRLDYARTQAKAGTS